MIVDTNLPIDVLRKIADYNQVAVMLCPPSMSVDCFFERDDADKAFIKEQIKKAENPEKTMANYQDILQYGAHKNYTKWENSNFFTIKRNDTTTDTRLETMELLAKHFGLADKH